ncbi:chitinase-like protein Idgf2 [Drosophila hydei]|uniref:Chitinase-like protein Idgf2 n=1 Tax=Drosophila hydei TaxID=7224 RepID=A0A6J1L913_DROHY|nr:chitinase-like protein Idgf2 [Drosophila hydei]XP_030080502.1 chitinase-like protein Idgf2 [Drosophila hydei]
MKQFYLLSFLTGYLVTVTTAASNLVCYYDSSSYTREGLGKLLNPDLEIALQFCSHLVYGYLGIRGDNYQAYSLNENLDIYKHQFSEVTAFKRKFPHLKVLLSVGGDHDIDVEHPNKYIELLEGEKVRQTAFIQSAYSLVKNYGFDGLDLAYQFPRNKPRKVHGELGSVWKSFKKLFTGDFIVDENAALHKEQFTAFVRDVKNSLRNDGFLLSLTVLPNVNSTWYFDIPSLNGLADFVNLAAFDFLTPARNPEEADYTAPLYELTGQNRLPHYNVDFQVKYWLQQGFPASKLNLGVASYGNAWKLSSESGLEGTPVVPHTEGPNPEGLQSQKAGLLSYPEICSKLSNAQNQYLKGNDSPLRRVSDPSKRYGVYAYRAVDGAVTEGLWISYDDPDAASNKAAYVRANNLGGIALFDLSYDDFRGQCTSDKYPILRSIKYRL